jgi:hypothetical protein
MPALTRHHNPDAPQESWQVFYGDVRVGTIAMRSGNPADTDRWGWSCGFYPAPVAPWPSGKCQTSMSAVGSNRKTYARTEFFSV